MAKGLRTCCVCHREHIFCPVCNPEDKLKPSWYFAYCGENCKDIYEVTSDYENGRIQINEAKKKLDKLDLSKIANFGESYQKTIAKINENFISVQSLENESTLDSNNDNNEGDSSNKSYRKPRIKKAKTDDSVE